MARALVKIVGQQNWLLNSNFNFWQRGTSTTSYGYLADRWCIDSGFTSYTTSRVADSSLGSPYALQMSATTVATGSYYRVIQPIETANVLRLAGKTLTFSVQIKMGSSWTGSLGIEATWGTGTDERFPTGGGSFSTTVASSSLSTTGYTQVSVTFALPSNATSLMVGVRFPGATTPNGATILLKQAMLNEGAAAAPFVLAGGDIAGELEKCYRYYEKSYDLNTPAGTNTFTGAPGDIASNPRPTTYFKAVKRVTPSIVIYSPTGTVNAMWAGGANTSYAAALAEIGMSSFCISSNGAPSTSDLRWHYTADAEL